MRAVAKFLKSRVLDKRPEGSILIFRNNKIPYNTAYDKSQNVPVASAKNHLDPSKHFDRTPNFDRLTQTDTGRQL